MVDQYQHVDVPVGLGINRKVDPRKAPPGTLITAENATLATEGKLIKRYGTDAIGRELAGSLNYIYTGASDAMEDPATLATHGDELLVLMREQVLSYAPAHTPDHFMPIDRLSPWTARDKTIAHGVDAAGDADVAIATNGLICYVWRTTVTGLGALTNAYASVVDGTTGAVLSTPTKLTSTVTYNPKVVAIGNIFVFTYSDNAGNIGCRTLDATSLPLTWSSDTAIVTDNRVTYGNYYDMCKVTNTSLFAVVYVNNGGGASSVTVKSFNTSKVQQATVDLTQASLAADLYFAISGDTSKTPAYYVAWLYSTGGNDILKTATLNSSLTVTNGPTTISTAATTSLPGAVGLCHMASGSAQLVWAENYLSTIGTAVLNSTGAITGSSQRRLYHAMLLSKPFYYLSKTWCVVSTSVSPTVTDGQATGLLLDLNGDNTVTSGLIPRPVCVVAPRQIAQASVNGNIVYSRWVPGSLGHVAVDGSGDYHHVIGKGSGVSLRCAVADVVFSSNTTARQTCELGGLTYIAEGVVKVYDGVQATEASFIYYPFVETATAVNATSGSLTTSSSYSYSITYIDRDCAGNRHVSAPYAVTVSTGTKNAANLTIVWQNLTLRQDNELSTLKMGVEIHRTAAGGTVKRRLTDERLPPASVTASSEGTMQNNTTGATFVYTDIAADACVASTSILYTTGGILDNVCPPSATLCCTHKSRVWLAGCPDRKEIWYSKAYVYGEAPGFNEGLTLRVDDGGDITAIKGMDDKLIIFKLDRCFYVTGDGPTDAGTQNDLSAPVLISGDTGCLDPNSVVQTPMGLMFRATKGIYLLTRGLEIVYLGQEVEDLLTSSYTVVAANLVRLQNEVRFVCTSANDSFELRYNYVAKGWTTAKYYDGSGTYGGRLRSAAVSRDGYYLIDANAQVLKENASTFLDGGNFVPMTCEFADFSVAGTQGYQSVSDVYVQFDKVTDCLMNVYVAVDSASYTDNLSVNSASLTRAQIDKHLLASTMKGQAHRVKVLDSQPGANLGNGGGFSLVGLTFKTGTLQGPFKQLGTGNKG